MQKLEHQIIKNQANNKDEIKNIRDEFETKLRRINAENECQISEIQITKDRALNSLHVEKNEIEKTLLSEKSQKMQLAKKTKREWVCLHTKYIKVITANDSLKAEFEIETKKVNDLTEQFEDQIRQLRTEKASLRMSYDYEIDSEFNTKV